MRARGIPCRRVSVRLLVLVGLLNAVLVSAQERPDTQPPNLRTEFASPSVQHIQLRPVAAPEHERPSALIPLYISLVGLQVLDVHSTRRAMSSGATRESNPLMKPFVNNEAAFIAVKASATAATIFVTEKLRKKHPKTAVILAATFNVAVAAVVTNNYRLSRRH